MNIRYIYNVLCLLIVSSVGRVCAHDWRPIDTRNAQQTGEWTLVSTNGFFLTDLAQPDCKAYISANKIVVAYNQGVLLLNGKKVSRLLLVISPASHEYTCNGNAYQEECAFIRTKNTLRVCVHAEKVPERKSEVAPSSSKKKKKRSLRTPKSIPLPHIDTGDSSGASVQSVPKSQSVMVKVLLAEQQLSSSPQWHMLSDNGFFITDTQSAQQLYTAQKNLTIMIKHNGVYVNGKKWLRDTVLIKPKAGHISFEGRSYQGSFLIMCVPKKSLVINCLDLEDYVVSVLQTESWPGWPLEVHKAFAIMCRSYVMSMITQAHKSKRSYHVCNTNVHQTYRGVHTSAILRQAVDETHGMLLVHDNKPVLAMFDSCCGGIIPAHIVGIDFVKAPYLAREYACHYCKPYKIYSWKQRYESAHLERLFARELGVSKNLKDIRVTKRDKAGLVQEVAVRFHGKRHLLHGKKLYSLLDGVKSFYFSVKKKAGNFLFEGRGYGHHIGLCQWGAREMVRLGRNHKHVLDFYYPGTQLMRLV